MNDYYEERLDELHGELARLYRGGSTDRSKIEGLWARIERLESTRVRLRVQEARVNGDGRG